jgi:hypothetical protein
MRVVLVAIGPSVPGDGLVAGVEALRRAGASVELISRQAPSAALAAVLDGITALPPARVRLAPVRRGRLRLDPDRLPAALRLRRAPSTRALLAGADVVVAVDQAAIPAAWLAARRSPRVIALSGLPAAVTRYARP